MTVWEFRHLQNGFSRFNGGGEQEARAPSEDEYWEALERFGVT